MLDIDKLEQAALAASPGEWHTDVFSYGIFVLAADNTLIETVYTGAGNATHIAAANPSAVLELINRLRISEKDAARYSWLRQQHDSDETQWHVRSGTYSIPAFLDMHIDEAMKEKP